MLDAVFRADASLEIGSGHVMRCLTLADALRERGARCRFVCREHEASLIPLIRKRGYEVLSLGGPPSGAPHATWDDAPQPPHSAWLRTDWRTDAAETRAALGTSKVDWLVVDHYALDARWEAALRPAVRRLMVIDDLADREHDCDLLLDQNLGRAHGDYEGRVPSDCLLLIGPAFALLRPRFAQLREQSLRRRRPPVLHRVLVAMGGFDKDNVTGDILRVIPECALPRATTLTVVMGPNAPWISQVRAQAERLGRPCEVLAGVPELADIIASSDLAIGGAGGTAWERCSLGVPSLIAVLADNQRAGAHALRDSGAALLLENPPGLDADLKAKLDLLLNPGTLQLLQEASAAITDGCGATRVADNLIYGCI